MLLPPPHGPNDTVKCRGDSPLDPSFPSAVSSTVLSWQSSQDTLPSPKDANNLSTTQAPVRRENHDVINKIQLHTADRSCTRQNSRCTVVTTASPRLFLTPGNEQKTGRHQHKENALEQVGHLRPAGSIRLRVAMIAAQHKIVN